MREKEIVQAIKRHVNGQNNDWKFVYGRDVFTKSMFIEKLDKDSNFRKIVVKMVYELSIDILARKGRP